MAIIPSRIQDQLDFFDQHQGPWGLNAASIGISSGQATAFKNAAAAARTAYNTQLAAQQTAKTATASAKAAIGDARTMCGNLINLIKGFADNSATPATVYSLAQIPAPASPSTAPPPGTASDFKVTLLQNGSVTIKWKCANPAGTSGTIYEVRRRIGGSTTPWVFIGATGLRNFNDDTIPSGTPAATYEVTAVRSTTRGNPATLLVQFGVGGDGVTFTMMGDEGTGQSKMAA